MLEPNLFVVFDTETTGLPLHPLASLAKQPRIIEFGAILTDGETILDELEFFADPGQPLEAIITKITGITNEMLRGEPSFEVNIPKVSSLFAKADIAFAHNMAFDQSLLGFELEIAQTRLDDINFPYPVCTVEETKPLFGFPMKLEKLHEIYIGPWEQTHRALDDVKRLHAVIKELGIYKAWGGK